MEGVSHYTKQIDEKNQVPSQVAESLNKLNLHKPQQDRQKQQAHHYLPQKGCSQCGAKGNQAEVCRQSRNQKCHNCGKLGHSPTCVERKKDVHLITNNSKQTNQIIFTQEINKTNRSELQQ